MEQVQVNPETVQPELTEAQKANKRVKRREKGVKAYQRLIIEIVILALIIWALFFFIIGIARMSGDDMMPKVGNMDMVLYYRLDKDVKFQDVIVYEKVDSKGNKQMMISRVVAGPGDTVTYTEEGALIVNGNNISEPEIYYRGTQFVGENAPTYPIVLGEDECFVLGDRRDQAYDSRAFGPVSKSEILGTVIMIFRRNNL